MQVFVLRTFSELSKVLILFFSLLLFPSSEVVFYQTRLDYAACSRIDAKSLAARVLFYIGLYVPFASFTEFHPFVFSSTEP